MDITTLAAAKKYTDVTVVGGGAIKGKNCTIDSISAITGGNRVTFKWTLDDGTTQTGTMDVLDGEKGDKGDKGNKGDTGATGASGADGEDGVSITEAEIDEYGHLIITYSDGDVDDAGLVSEGTLVVANPSDSATDDLSKIQIGETVYGISGGANWTDVTGTLTTGSTSITLSDASITTTSTIEVYNDLDVPYNSKSLSTGSITLTFDAQESDMSVKVRVS